MAPALTKKQIESLESIVEVLRVQKNQCSRKKANNFDKMLKDLPENIQRKILKLLVPQKQVAKVALKQRGGIPIRTTAYNALPQYVKNTYPNGRPYWNGQNARTYISNPRQRTPWNTNRTRAGYVAGRANFLRSLA